MATNNVLIYSEQAAIFNHPNDYDTKCSIGVKEFKYLPEWVLESTMFILLKRSNSIRVAGNARDQIEMEMNGIGGESKAEPVEPPTSAELDNKLTDYTKMRVHELYDLCVEKSLEPEKNRNKDYYLGLLVQNEVATEN